MAVVVYTNEMHYYDVCSSRCFQLQMFEVPSCTSKQDLTSGVAISHVLYKIDPSWFNEAWLGRIKEESGGNWRLKVSNLKKILQSMLEYYHDVLGHQVSDEHLPDVGLIGEMGDVTELGKLLQLVLGCAVSCEKKQEHIQQIMTLEESVQHVVMTAIQEVSEKYYFLSEEVEEREDLSQRCREQERQLAVLQEDKSALQAELQALKERLSCADAQDASTAVTGKKLLLLQSQMEQLQEENFRLESSRDDARLRCEVLEREVFELQHRNEDLTSLAQEAQTLKDEMDILRHSSDRVSRLEAMVDTYKRKLEDLGDLRRQVRLLEERNNVYMQRTCELEEELRRANAIRGQLDTYKRQVHELHTKHSSEALKAEKWQFEYKNLHDKYDALLKEKERLLSERDTLRETNEELRCAQVQQKCLSQASSSVGNLASEIMPTEFTETVVRLQSENKMLCVQEESYRQQLSGLQSQLEESQRTNNTLETQNRLNQQQVSDLRSQVEELQKALQEQGSKTEDVSPDQHNGTYLYRPFKWWLHPPRHQTRPLRSLQCQRSRTLAKKIDELQEILRRKDEDMRMMENRYKRYVEKARTVIETLDPKQKPHAVSPEVQALKNQLTEKDRKIQYLQVRWRPLKNPDEDRLPDYSGFTLWSLCLCSRTLKSPGPGKTRRRSSSSSKSTLLTLVPILAVI
uniref:Calponin-homology (CH) domain-containing protein n=1 Tax=Denticeps clupeoides TaxID=299321 RepID=A0AAY4C5C5_9TELE